jgi:hypothetical protein
MKTPIGVLSLLASVVSLAVFAPGVLAGGASLAFTPSAHDYGTIDKNTTGSQTFTLKNSSGSTGVLKAALTNSSSVFSITADSCTGTTLGPKKQCSVTVKYAPTTDGSTDNGSLTVSGKKLSVSASASLIGHSTQAKSSESDCESLGGVAFMIGGIDDLGQPLLWSCIAFPVSGYSDIIAKGNLLNGDCFADGGVAASEFADPFNPNSEDVNCYS